MRRNAIETLLEWKKKSHRKPLLLRGARQVGKTWLVREFGKTYQSFVELNLEEQPELIQLFNRDLGQPKKLIGQLNLVLNKKIVPQETLLFIDEIQESSSALKALRYFHEKLPELDVVAAGSLLEFTMREISFPVGRIEFLYLFPLNFREYLLALGESELVEYLTTSHHPEKGAQISNLLHDKLANEIKNYCFLGGMPEVLKTYIETRDFQQCFDVQGDLINNFRFDFSKYASRAKLPHLRVLFDSVPTQFSKKFVYARIADDVRARELNEALYLLNAAGLIYPCYHTSANGVPLSAEINLKKFKVYFLDIGLSLRSLGFKPKDLPCTVLSDLVNQGGLMEQFVCQELLSYTEKGTLPTAFYWQREALNSSAEVDFLINIGKKVIPIEVKSGGHRSSKSLGIFASEKKSSLVYCVSMSKTQLLSQRDHFQSINLSFYDISSVFS